MFGDLDWPLNASRGLSAVAEFLVYGSPLSMSTLQKNDQIGRDNIYGGWFSF